jgi:hypothetical protein
MNCQKIQESSPIFLSKWIKLYKNCFPPTCDSFISKENKKSVHALVRHLFNERFNIFDSYLTDFKLVMFATLLMSLTEMVEEYGESTLVNVIIQRYFIVGLFCYICSFSLFVWLIFFNYALFAIVYVSHVEDKFFNTPRL